MLFAPLTILVLRNSIALNLQNMAVFGVAKCCRLDWIDLWRSQNFEPLEKCVDVFAHVFLASVPLGKDHDDYPQKAIEL